MEKGNRRNRMERNRNSVIDSLYSYYSYYYIPFTNEYSRRPVHKCPTRDNIDKNTQRSGSSSRWMQKDTCYAKTIFALHKPRPFCAYLPRDLTDPSVATCRRFSTGFHRKHKWSGRPPLSPMLGSRSLFNNLRIYLARLAGKIFCPLVNEMKDHIIFLFLYFRRRTAVKANSVSKY